MKKVYTLKEIEEAVRLVIKQDQIPLPEGTVIGISKELLLKFAEDLGANKRDE